LAKDHDRFSLILRLLMSKQGKASNYGAMFVKDLLFIVPFFIISFFSLRHTVPSNNPFWILFWAAVAAGMMSGIAWIALQMFKVVLADQLARERATRERR
jgi:ABC-type uncharacterized transport system permease subunit